MRIKYTLWTSETQNFVEILLKIKQNIKFEIKIEMKQKSDKNQIYVVYTRDKKRSIKI